MTDHTLSPPLLPNTRVDRLIATGFIVIGVGFGGMAVWGALAPVHSAITASGALAPESGRKTLRHPTGGQIAEVLVRGGDSVKAGQVLLRLDPTEERTRLEVLTAAWADALALEARLTAELADRESIEWPAELIRRRAETPDIDRLIKNQQTLFDVRRQQLASEATLAAERIAALEVQAASLVKQKASVSREAEEVTAELRINEELLSRGNAMRARVVELRRDAARIDGSGRELDTELARTNHQITEARSELVRRRNDVREKVVQELEKARAEVARQAEQIRDAANRLANRAIKAPEDGAVVVHGHPVAGGVIAPNEPILEVVPMQGALLAEVKVSPRDIKALAVDLPVRIQLTAFDSRVLGTLDGVVSYVSADRVVDVMTRTEHYLVRVRLKDAVGDTVHDLKIKAGMPVDAQITLSARTPLDYLITPLKQSYLKAFIQE